MHLLPITLACSLACTLNAATLTVDSTDKELTVKLDGQILTAYRTDSRVPYLYPLHSPSGACLSRHWPMRTDVAGEERDHPHHRSLWLSHGLVNGHDFWAWTTLKTAEPRINHLRFRDQKSLNGNEAFFTADLTWTANDAILLNESRTHHFRVHSPTTYLLEIRSTLTATNTDVTFGDTKEGFFAIRVDRTLRLKGPSAKGAILNSNQLTQQDVWGKQADWVAFHGPDEKQEPAVIAILDHPTNPRHPTWWHARDYGLLAANPFGQHDFESLKNPKAGDLILKKGSSITFRYLVLIHHGSIDSAHIQDHWKTFANP